MKKLLLLPVFLGLAAALHGQLHRPSITQATLNGVTTISDTTCVTLHAMTGNVITVTLADQYMTVDGNETLTLSGTPATVGQRFGFSLAGDGTARTITLPAGTWKKLDGSNATVTTFTLPANGKAVLGVKYFGSSTYEISGIPAIAGTDYVSPSTAASHLGTHSSPDTTAGTLSWTTPLYAVFSNTATTYTLPAAANYSDRAVIFYVTGTNVVTIDPNASEVIVRDGTAQTGGVTMTLTGAAGNYVSLISDGVRWVTLGYKGTLAAGS